MLQTQIFSQTIAPPQKIILSGYNFILAYIPTHPPSLKAVGFLAALWCYF